MAQKLIPSRRFVFDISLICPILVVKHTVHRTYLCRLYDRIDINFFFGHLKKSALWPKKSLALPTTVQQQCGIVLRLWRNYFSHLNALAVENRLLVFVLLLPPCVDERCRVRVRVRVCACVDCEKLFCPTLPCTPVILRQGWAFLPAITEFVFKFTEAERKAKNTLKALKTFICWIKQQVAIIFPQRNSSW